MNFETEKFIRKKQLDISNQLKNEKLFSYLLIELFLYRVSFSGGKKIEVILIRVTNYELLIPIYIYSYLYPQQSARYLERLYLVLKKYSGIRL